MKIFVQETNGVMEVVLITDSKELRLNPMTGERISAHLHKIDTEQHNFMQIRSAEKQQTIVAIPRDAYANDQQLKQTGKVQKPIESETPMFYTQIQDQTVTGYSIDRSTLIGKKIWSLNIGMNEKLVDLSTQYTTDSLASEPNFVLPTVMGTEGILLYKYLDSNMFSLTTQSLDDLSTYTIIFVNGVTGSIIHQQQIDNVSP